MSSIAYIIYCGTIDGKKFIHMQEDVEQKELMHLKIILAVWGVCQSWIIISLAFTF